MATVTPPVKKRRFCPHCSEVVGYSTYYRHQNKYFDLKTQRWNTVSENEERETRAIINTEEECDTAMYESK